MWLWDLFRSGYKPGKSSNTTWVKEMFYLNGKPTSKYVRKTYSSRWITYSWWTGAITRWFAKRRKKR